MVSGRKPDPIGRAGSASVDDPRAAGATGNHRPGAAPGARLAGAAAKVFILGGIGQDPVGRAGSHGPGSPGGWNRGSTNQARLRGL